MDVIVLATGFDSHAFFRPMKLIAATVSRSTSYGAAAHMRIRRWQCRAFRTFHDAGSA
ncbi:hypothetical protein I551_8424 [Mycobacterium ulcerans str. Harvey]|uniref:L-lysine N(6)-monooxygenase (NADPH) n=1 Tax=Mycobacterium ulcerans str. Harvey TaxID=1299332 RepID=A0ABN0QKK9_MYCUL|nr:hypothetical protein I551_8424 [Mycobacterium ulcerans str. Harvey]